MTTDLEFRAPRFMTDGQLRDYFGLTERALMTFRAMQTFPQKDGLINKTDRRAVEIFFDRRAGIPSPSFANGNSAVADGEEDFTCLR
jgi:hypothetical protein